MEKIVKYFEQMIPGAISAAISIALALAVFFLGIKICKRFIKHIRKRMQKREVEPGVITFLCSALTVVSYVIFTFTAAQIMGMATSSIVAIVGSAGLAIGLALQGSLKNFAGGVLILLMKPFVIDDYIIVGDIEGYVKKIDIVYTTLITADNRSVILPNGNLADSNIINTTKEGCRRLDIVVGIEYSQNIGEAKQVLEKTIEDCEYCIKDKDSTVVVSELSESYVSLMIQLWVEADVYLAAKYCMLELVKERLDEANINIPYNHLDVMVHKAE